MKVHVLYVVNGTTCNDWFECGHASSQVVKGGAIVKFTKGFEVHAQTGELTPVISAQYAHVERIVRYKDVEP